MESERERSREVSAELLARADAELAAAGEVTHRAKAAVAWLHSVSTITYRVTSQETLYEAKKPQSQRVR